MSALHMEKITEHSKDFHRTENLYVRAFPANERTPVSYTHLYQLGDTVIVVTTREQPVLQFNDIFV